MDTESFGCNHQINEKYSLAGMYMLLYIRDALP